MNPLRIGNAQAFWGDRSIAAKELVTQFPELDYVTLDYLAEVSMSILALQKEKDSNAGYAKDFLNVIQSLIPHWKSHPNLKLITNAGGLNPLQCALECKKILEQNNLSFKIGVIFGDDILHLISKTNLKCINMDTHESIDSYRDKLVSANVYLGSLPIVQALKEGATIIITGRIADPCLVSSACIYHFEWNMEEYDLIASAIIAGHLIECGTQVTGGFSTYWLEYPEMENVGYPIIEMYSDGTFIVTKAENSGGVVTIETVKEQLLYEIGDPEHYLCPDATVSFLNLELHNDGQDRIKITGAKGAPPPKTLKASITYHDGYIVEGMISIFGKDCRKKAIRCAAIIEERLKKAGHQFEEFYFECLGTGDIVPSLTKSETIETVLRIAARAPSKEPLEALSKEIAPLVTHGPQGTTGYLSGRPKVREVYSFWPSLIESKLITPKVEIL